MSARTAPSIVSADCTKRGDEVRQIQAADADLNHFDVAGSATFGAREGVGGYGTAEQHRERAA